MKRTTHKTLALFALLLFALTTVGSAQSSKTFESHRKSFSLKAPANFNYAGGGQAFRSFSDQLTITNEKKGERSYIKVYSKKVPSHIPSKTILNKMVDNFSRMPGGNMKFQNKISKVTVSYGPIYLRKGTLTPPRNSSIPQATIYCGHLSYKGQGFLFQIVYPKNKPELKNKVFQILKSFTLK